MPGEGNGASGLFPVVGIDQDGNGTVDEQFHLHVGAEFTGHDPSAGIFLELLNEFLVKGDGRFRPGRPDIGGTVPLFRAGMKSELADYQDLSGDILEGQVHNPLLVPEHPETGDFAAQPFHIGFGIRFLDPKQDKQSRPDGRFNLPPNAYRGMLNPLDYRSHLVYSKRESSIPEFIVMLSTSAVMVCGPMLITIRWG
jgi:hypothetical protein